MRASQEHYSGENCFLDLSRQRNRPMRASQDNTGVKTDLSIFPGTYKGLCELHKNTTAVKTASSIFQGTETGLYMLHGASTEVKAAF